MAFNDLHAYYNGIGNSDVAASLPPTALPDSKKGKKWKKAVVDAIERVGEQQLSKNLQFRQYYKMIEGRLNYVDAGFQDLPEFTKDIQAIREEYGIPTFLKHYDIIGIIINTLVGTYTDFKDEYRVDSIDEYSTNEFIREKTLKIQQFAQEEFSIELQKLLLQKGVNPFKQDFQSEEEQQAYIQNLEANRQALTPDEIDGFMSKNFKVLATEWAENTLEEDTKRFYLDEKDREEMIDFLLTGRFFRHYKIGYDSYDIERWSPLNTFFSQDVNAKYPQDGEYVGRIHFFSPSDIINRYGYLLSAKEQENLSNYYNQNEYDSDSDAPKDGMAALERGFGADTHIVPFENHYDHDLLKQFESAFGTPLGERHITKADGSTEVYDSWLPSRQNETYLGSHYASNMRDDIDVRSDVLQVTEGYFRAYKRIGLLTFEDDNGTILQEIVTDDLLSEFIKKYEIKKLRSVSLEEIEKAQKKDKLEDYIDTIVYTYHPEIYSFIKINNTNSRLDKDLYFVEPLDFQIKGSDSNVYDFKLPVTGIIDNSIALKLRPYQQMVNICMNQNWNILEKEIGLFFLMDINYLPDEFKEDKNAEEALIEMRDLAKNLGLVPVDMSKQNIGNQQHFNSFIRQDLTYGSQVEYRMALAEKYKQLALEQIGITPQLLGQPNKYLTSEGVQQGAQASYAQISPIFDKVTVARAKDKDVHLSVAQYCQANGKDSTTIYRNSDGDHYFLDIMQEDGELFPLRHLGVVPHVSSKDKKRIEQLKQIFTQNNTLTNDLEAFTQLWNSDTMTEVVHIAKEASKKAEAAQQAQRAHEQDLVNKQVESEERKEAMKLANENEQRELDRINKIEVEKIESLGRAIDNDADNSKLDYLVKQADIASKTQENREDAAIKSKEVDRKIQQDSFSHSLALKELGLKAKELRLKEKDIQSKNFTSIINKN